MRGDPYLARLLARAVLGFGGPKRKIRGQDFAGRVEAVGRGVTRLRPGDEVYGDLGFADGALPSTCASPTTERHPSRPT
jgi:NADPH:quinone reductase-like Zn-dependent oxidoreductase